MTHEEICDQLQAIRPGSHWKLTDNTYDGLVWLDTLPAKPTAEELGL